MIQLIGGELYQWDTGRIVQVIPDDGTVVHEVHFSTSNMDFAYVVKTYSEADNVFCAIPNIILQQYRNIICYEVCENDSGEETISSITFKITRRSRPYDYVYTEPELITLEKLSDRIDKLAEIPSPVQSDWNQTDEESLDFIKNKPNVISETKIKELIDDKLGVIENGTY